MGTTIFDSFTIVSSSETPFTMSLFGLNTASLHAPLLFFDGNIAQTASSAMPEFSPGVTDYAVTYANGLGFTNTKVIKRNVGDNSIIIASQSNLMLDTIGNFMNTPGTLTKIDVYVGSIITGGGSSSIEYSNVDVGQLPFQSVKYHVYINDQADDNVWGETYATTHGSSTTYDAGLDKNTILLTGSALPFANANSSVVSFFFIREGNLLLQGVDNNKFYPFHGSFRISAPSDEVYGALGKYTTVYGNKSFALGPYATVYGASNVANHYASFVAGANNENTNNGKFGQFVCGASVKTQLRFPTGSNPDNFGNEKFIVGAGGLVDPGNLSTERFLNFEVVVDSNGSSSMIIPHTFNSLVGGPSGFVPNPKTGSMFYHTKAERLLIYNGTSWTSKSFS